LAKVNARLRTPHPVLTDKGRGYRGQGTVLADLFLILLSSKTDRCKKGRGYRGQGTVLADLFLILLSSKTDRCKNFKPFILIS